MFKTILASIILLAIVFLSSISQSDSVDNNLDNKNVVIVTNRSYEYMKYINFDAKVYSYFKNHSKVKIKKFYLNCHSDCTEGEFKSRFDIIWKKILMEDPEYLIVYDSLIWDTYKEKIIEYAKNHKVALTQILNKKDHNKQFSKIIKNDIPVFIEEYSVEVKDMIDYFIDNGKDFQTFYILRDSCKYNLKIANLINDELKKINFNYDVNVIEIFSEQHLKSLITELQSEHQGVIIPVLKNVSDNNGGYISINNILKIIQLHNKKHIEVSLTYDASKYLALSYTNLLCDYKNTNILDDDNGISVFLTNSDNKMNFFYDCTYVILNEKEMRRLYNGEHLLKRTSNYIDIFR